MKNKTVEDIVREYLAKNGYDGLYNDAGDCACKLDNLFVCDQVGTECSAGYLQPSDKNGEYEFRIGEEKTKAKNDVHETDFVNTKARPDEVVK